MPGRQGTVNEIHRGYTIALQGGGSHGDHRQRGAAVLPRKEEA
jgi:hypothetical protein